MTVMKMKKVLPVLGVAVLLGAAAFPQFVQAQSGVNKEEIQAIVKEYLTANPEIVIQAIEAYQTKQQQQEEASQAEALKKNKDAILNMGSPMAGNPNGDVVVVEFFDYNCGYCKKALPDIKKLIDEDKNVKVIFKELPILSDSSEMAARWALAADKQGKYWDYHVALMNFTGPKTKETLTALAKEAGLDAEKLAKDAESKAVREMLEKTSALSRELGIRGTPAFIINDMLAPGYMGYDSMKEAVDAARAGKQGG